MASSLRLLEHPSADPRSEGRQERGLIVMKFGGTSVGSVARLRQVVRLVDRAAHRARVVVVVSAAAGVTDRIVGALDALAEDRARETDLPAWLAERYAGLAAGLLSLEGAARYESAAARVLARLHSLLGEAAHEGVTPALRDAMLGTGERLSAPLLALALDEVGHVALPVASDRLVRTDAAFGRAAVDQEATGRLVRRWHATLDARALPVVTGFVGAAPDGRPTTLGRGGSDYSAALLAAHLGADVLERWTDVDGLYTADPRTDPDARPLRRLVLAEAAAWNHAGRLGMHRKALDPLRAAGVPVHVRSTARPDHPGTLIVAEEAAPLSCAVGF